MTKRKPTRARGLGVTDADYDRMLAAQGGGCAICGNPPKTRALNTDHDHKTGKVRGLLCHRCNRVMWAGRDSPELFRAFALYLEEGPRMVPRPWLEFVA